MPRLSIHPRPLSIPLVGAITGKLACPRDRVHASAHRVRSEAPDVMEDGTATGGGLSSRTENRE